MHAWELGFGNLGSVQRLGRHVHSAYLPSGLPFSLHRNPSSTNGHCPGPYSARRRSAASRSTHSPSTDMLAIRSSSSTQYLLPSPAEPRTAAALLITSAPAAGRPLLAVSVSLAAPRPEEAAATSSDREERTTQTPHSAIWSPPAAWCAGFALLRGLAMSIETIASLLLAAVAPRRCRRHGNTNRYA